MTTFVLQAASYAQGLSFQFWPRDPGNASLVETLARLTPSDFGSFLDASSPCVVLFFLDNVDRSCHPNCPEREHDLAPEPMPEHPATTTEGRILLRASEYWGDDLPTAAVNCGETEENHALCMAASGKWYGELRYFMPVDRKLCHANSRNGDLRLTYGLLYETGDGNCFLSKQLDHVGRSHRGDEGTEGGVVVSSPLFRDYLPITIFTRGIPQLIESGGFHDNCKRGPGSEHASNPESVVRCRLVQPFSKDNFGCLSSDYLSLEQPKVRGNVVFLVRAGGGCTRGAKGRHAANAGARGLLAVHTEDLLPRHSHVRPKVKRTRRDSQDFYVDPYAYVSGDEGSTSQWGDADDDDYEASLKWPSTFVGAGVLTIGDGEMLAKKLIISNEEVDVVLDAVCFGDVKEYLPWLSYELRHGRNDLHELHYTHSLMRAKNAWVKKAARYDELRNYDPNGHYPY